ncbi:MAG TPA: 3-hydroxyacyl-CoA dehydrogenase NAD-binding domain-containing protein [Candidatus Limnocylindria bacterium]|nr:3-hydroxyacyl-CoA dehydrogenase NAD-binding domain-containing protein [Candidatus Limnocylindria bacterium]
MSEPRLGVVGAGTMGAGIAQVCATAGLQVVMVDVGLEQLQRGQQTIAGSLARLEAKQKLPRPATEISGRIHTSTSVSDLGRVDLVIEAAFEDLAVKSDLFRKLDGACKPEAILASNTSSISITRLAAATKRPAKVVGMHFMNPVPVMGHVELIRGLETSDATMETARELATRLGKIAVESGDSPGFIANRVLMPMINEAVFALAEGVGTVDAIDTMLRGLNFPMGPLALADLIGLDVCLAILEVLQRDFGDPKYRPAPLLRQYVAAGRLGRKSGRGFHEYAE